MIESTCRESKRTHIKKWYDLINSTKKGSIQEKKTAQNGHQKKNLHTTNKNRA
jgi:hypothetical protein